MSSTDKGRELANGRLSSSKQKLLQLMIEGKRVRTAGSRPNAGDYGRLSVQELASWNDIKDAQSGVSDVPPNHLSMLLAFDTPLDLNVLRTALQTLVLRHEAFRTVYRDEGGVAKAVVLDNVDVDIVQIDARERFSSANGIDFVSLIAKLDNIELNVQSAPLWRVAHLSGLERQHLHIIVHHAVFDGWSSGIFLEDLDQVYSALASNTAVPPYPTDYTYRDYAMSHDPVAARELDEAATIRWRKMIDQAIDTDDFDFHFQPKTSADFKHDKTAFELDPEVVSRASAMAKIQGASAFNVLQLCYRRALAEVFDLDGVFVVSPVSNRPGPHDQLVIGKYASSILTFSRREDFSDALRGLRVEFAETTEALKYQSINFREISERLFPRGDVLPFSFSFGNYPTPSPYIGDSKWEIVKPGFTTLRDLSLTVLRDKENVFASAQFNAMRFSKSEAQSLFELFQRNIEKLADKVRP